MFQLMKNSKIFVVMGLFSSIVNGILVIDGFIYQFINVNSIHVFLYTMLVSLMLLTSVLIFEQNKIIKGLNGSDIDKLKELNNTLTRNEIEKFSVLLERRQMLIEQLETFHFVSEYHLKDRMRISNKKIERAKAEFLKSLLEMIFLLENHDINLANKNSKLINFKVDNKHNSRSEVDKNIENLMDKWDKFHIILQREQPNFLWN
ncbi:hypothetical protein FLK61_37595 [Paenalkalicoccus suaedae]|uniref:Uncharacterized protein n=1 Tax=Paenalkalicoccus suaedae TaxID=2592382 RepID=A0A859FHP0_9BACI|nr:hypothetical protein [Paenalkalicoccus suaedae]QKS72348.1 hypothetical protein FLK61_37595 [Paenalkalicoccus suaedae]